MLGISNASMCDGSESIFSPCSPLAGMSVLQRGNSPPCASAVATVGDAAKLGGAKVGANAGVDVLSLRDGSRDVLGGRPSGVVGADGPPPPSSCGTGQ